MNAETAISASVAIIRLEHENHSLRMQLESARTRERAMIEEAEQLRDAVRAHLLNADRLNAIVNPSVTEVDPAAFHDADAELEASRNTLFCLIEDAFLLPAHELQRALSC